MFEIVIRPTGDLVDFLAWDEFSEVMSRVTETGKAKVVVDMAAVNRMSSSYIGSIISSFRTARENEKEMILVNVNAKLYELLDMLKLTEMMVIERA